MNCAAMWSLSPIRSKLSDSSACCDTPETVPDRNRYMHDESYRWRMKNLRILSTLLTPLLLASVVFAQSIAFAQTKDERGADTVSTSDEISAARSQYSTSISPDAEPDAKDDNTLAQFPRARPGMQFPHQRGYSRGSYQAPWMDHGSAGHVLIGAAIGFGIGAALGARNSAQNGTPVSGGIMIGGGIFGLIGGCVGGAIGSSYGGLPPFAHRRRHRRSWSWPDEDEESNIRSQSSSGHAERSHPTDEVVATTPPTSATPPDSSPAQDFAKPGTLTAAIRISQ
jgi:hypothetical protein